MVSIASCFNYDLSVEQQLELIESIGFKSFSLSGRYEHNGLLEDTNGLIALVRKSDLEVDTIHGCCADDKDVLEVLEKCCYVASQLGSHIVVVHPCVFFITEDQVEEKFEGLMSIADQLVSMAERYNIRFALENLHPDAATEVLKRALDELDPEYFGLCYDITHAQIDGPRECALLSEYGHRIIAVHISDRVQEFVDHVIPGEGFIDFNPLIEKLGTIEYKGSVLMEVLSDFTQYKNPEVLVKKAYDEALKIESRLEGFQLNVS